MGHVSWSHRRIGRPQGSVDHVYPSPPGRRGLHLQIYTNTDQGLVCQYMSKTLETTYQPWVITQLWPKRTLHDATELGGTGLHPPRGTHRSRRADGAGGVHGLESRSHEGEQVVRMVTHPAGSTAWITKDQQQAQQHCHSGMTFFP